MEFAPSSSMAPHTRRDLRSRHSSYIRTGINNHPHRSDNRNQSTRSGGSHKHSHNHGQHKRSHNKHNRQGKLSSHRSDRKALDHRKLLKLVRANMDRTQRKSQHKFTGGNFSSNAKSGGRSPSRHNGKKRLDGRNGDSLKSTHNVPSTSRKDNAHSSSASKKKKTRSSKSKTHFTVRKRRKLGSRAPQPDLSTQVQPSTKLVVSKLRLQQDGDDSMSKCLTQKDHVIHVEVCALQASTAKVSEIRLNVKELLRSRSPGETILSFQRNDFLRANIQSIKLNVPVTERKSATNNMYQIQVYQLSTDGPSSEELEDEDFTTAKHWMLPNTEFSGLWDNLVFDGQLKEQLLNYAVTTLMYSNMNVDNNIITCNRVVLLHGPPGTGKTSLCKALAQKVCIRMSHKYRYGLLIEINSHGLFSKWFSESGKLVVKMFQKIQEYVDDANALVCILIDEVESLTAARKHMMNGNEPSDSIRVVNALLTQLDQVKRNPNVLVLTTSNVTGAIDLAFVDRADIKQYVGPPNAEAIYIIYRGIIHELMRVQVVSPELVLIADWKALEKMKSTNSCSPVTRHSIALRNLANASVGLSGRLLRKVPILAHSVYLQASVVGLMHFAQSVGDRRGNLYCTDILQLTSMLQASKMSLDAYWAAMNKCIENQFRDRRDLGRDPEV